MKILDDIKQYFEQRQLKSPQTRTVVQYLAFVAIAAVFWCFLTYNTDQTLKLEMPVEISMPDNVHLLNKPPDTLTVTMRDRGYRFIKYVFNDLPTLTLRFSDYSDGNSIFKVDQSHLKNAVASVLDLNQDAKIESVLPEMINIKYTDLPGKKVPIKMDVTIIPKADYIQNGAMVKSQDSVLVYSDAKSLDNISEVYTYHIEVKDLTDTLRRKITIAPINGAVVEPRSIDITVPIEKLVRRERQVAIAVRNAPPGVKVMMFPSEVKVSFRAPASRLNDEAVVTAVVDYNSINLMSNKVKVMIGEVPAIYQDVSLSNDSVEYKIEKR